MSAWLVVMSVGSAHAAEATRLVQPGHLEVGLRYDLKGEQGGLQEGGVRISDRAITRQDLSVRAAGSPVRGLVLVLEAVATPQWHTRFRNARRMVLDPVSGSGTYLTDETASDRPLDVRAAGFTGLWGGAAIGGPVPGPPVSRWRLEAAVRTPSPRQNLWTAPSGQRGTAPGGIAVRFAGAFSARTGAWEPFVQASWQYEGPVAVDVVDEAGTAWADDLRLQPAGRLSLTAGAALAVPGTPQLALEGTLGAAYVGPGAVATGVGLPAPLDLARTIPVQVGEQVAVHAQLGVDAWVRQRIHLRSGLRARWGTPYRVEHVYDVRTTADTWSLGWFVSVDGVTGPS